MRLTRSITATSAMAVGLILAGVLLHTDSLAQWFSPQRPASDAVLNGARLLRTMFVVVGVAIVPAVLALRSPCSRSSSSDVEPASAVLWSTRERWTVLGLVVVAAIARLPRLAESLWYDEIAAWRDYAVHGPGTIVGTYFDPANHIFHTLLTWLSAEVLGASELSLRLPAFIASLLAVPAVYALTRTVLSVRIATWAGCIAAMSPVLVLEGVESRGYSMMIAASATLTMLLLANMRDERRWRWIMYVIVAGLGIWAHMMTVWVPIGHALWLGVHALRTRSWSVARRGWVVVVMSAVFTITLYAPVIPSILHIRSIYGGRSDTPGVFGVEGLHMVLQAGGAWYWWAALPGLALAAIGVACALRSPRDSGVRTVIGASMIGLPAMIGVVVVLDSWMYARFALFMMPGAAICMAIGLDALWKYKRSAGLLAMAVVLGAWTADLIVRPPRQPLREAATFVNERTNPDERVLVVGLRHEVLRAYAGHWRMSFAPDHGHGRALETALDARPIRWAVVYYPKKVSTDRYDVLRNEGFQRIQTWPGWIDWGHGNVEVWGR